MSTRKMWEEGEEVWPTLVKMFCSGGAHDWKCSNDEENPLVTPALIAWMLNIMTCHLMLTSLHLQESCAIAKVTAQCTPHMGSLP